MISSFVNKKSEDFIDGKISCEPTANVAFAIINAILTENKISIDSNQLKSSIHSNNTTNSNETELNLPKNTQMDLNSSSSSSSNSTNTKVKGNCNPGTFGIDTYGDEGQYITEKDEYEIDEEDKSSSSLSYATAEEEHSLSPSGQPSSTKFFSMDHINEDIEDYSKSSSSNGKEPTRPKDLSDSYENVDIFHKYEDYNKRLKEFKQGQIDEDQSSIEPPEPLPLQQFREFKNINVHSIQKILDSFKHDNLCENDCDSLIEILKFFRKRDDFQWTLHQIGGFNALLFLLGRVFEICDSDVVQAKALSLVLAQLKSQRSFVTVENGTSIGLSSLNSEKYNLIRFLLNSSKANFGFHTFTTLVKFSLNPKGNRIDDYDLLSINLLSCWKCLLVNRCREPDIPTINGTSTCLFECLLQTILDLCLENGLYRSYNIEILKIHSFSDILLSICNVLCTEPPKQLTLVDAVKLSSLVKSLLIEIMAPPDGQVAISLIRYGLLPMLPKELPTLPKKSDSYFLYGSFQRNSNINKLSNVDEGIEISEEHNIHQSQNQDILDRDVPEHFGIVPTSSHLNSSSLVTENLHENNSDLRANTELNNLRISDIPNVQLSNNREDQLQSRYNIVLGKDNTIPASETSNSTSMITFIEIFKESMLEALMSILLNSFSILADEVFRKLLEPNIIAHIFVAYCSHTSVTLKKLSVQLLSAYLNRVKNPIVTELIKHRGFYLISLYLQTEGPNTDLSSTILSTSREYGPHSYPLVIGNIGTNSTVNMLNQWIQSDDGTVVQSLVSSGLLPAIIKQYNSKQHLSRSLSVLLHLTIKYLILSPSEEPWKILFIPGIESSPTSHYIISKILQDSIEILRKYTGNELKKSEYNNRLLWILERISAIKQPQNFEKWLLKLYIMNIMEYNITQTNEGSEYWKYFIKKFNKKCYYLFGLFLTRIFAPNQDDLDFKQQVLRSLIHSSGSLSKWIPKVIRSDDRIERCFTAFIRVFLSEAETRSNIRLCNIGNDTIFHRRPSFHSLISTNFNTNLNTNTKDIRFGETISSTSVNLDDGTSCIESQIDLNEISGNNTNRLSDRVIRSTFENILVQNGLLSPTNSFSTIRNTNWFSTSFSSRPNSPSLTRTESSTDLKTLRILLEATPISGISHSELRQCLTTMEKLRQAILYNKNITNSVRRNSIVSYNIKISNNPSTIEKFIVANSNIYFEQIFENVHSFAIDVLDVVTRIRTKQEIEVAKRISTRNLDIVAKEGWLQIRNSLIHPKAPWHFPSLYPKFWSLNQSEGPSRVRIRLKREHLKIHNRFLKHGYRNKNELKVPLEYLFEIESSEYLNYPILQSEIEFIRFCVRIKPGEELPGEIIVNNQNIYFFCEECNLITNHCCSDKVLIGRDAIFQIHNRRYTLEERAVEIFVENRSYLFVFRTTKDRDEFNSILITKNNYKNIGLNTKKNMLLSLPTSLVTSQWVKGHLSNFDYIMYLNTSAGRTYTDLMQYPIFPFVLSKYNSPTVDLHAPPSYRDLRKPMAIQDPAKEEHFVSTYNYLKRECDSTPFHYGSHYSNSGIVLHFLVRLPPYTQHFLKYQDGSFDIPDRSFHSIHTTWKLASKDSNTDFKEAIPEFYYLPEFLQNLQNFDLGVRQNGKRVDDVILPPWAKGDPRIFVLVNRQALESQEVRRNLGNWIDLIFGYKQSGKAAVQAVNVFHPSTYEGFEVDADGADDVIQRARRAMISTYGQTPKKLFQFPHAKPQLQRIERCEEEVIDTVWGLRWGELIGSPSSPDLDVISTREYREPIQLFESQTRIIFWPKNTLILKDSVVGSWDLNGIRIKSNVIYLSRTDEITTVNGIERFLWIGHQSGRITVLKLNETLDEILQRTDLIGHYEPIQMIDLNEEFSIAISCSKENYAIIWDMNELGFSNVISTDDEIDSVYSSRTTGDILLLHKSNNYLSYRTINGFLIGEIHPHEIIESGTISSLDPGRNVNLIAVGCECGLIKFYSTWDMKYVSQIKALPIWNLPIKSIRYSRDGRRIYCFSVTETKYITVALQLLSQKSN